LFHHPTGRRKLPAIDDSHLVAIESRPELDLTASILARECLRDCAGQTGGPPREFEFHPECARWKSSSEGEYSIRKCPNDLTTAPVLRLAWLTEGSGRNVRLSRARSTRATRRG